MISRSGSIITLALPSPTIAEGVEWILRQLLAHDGEVSIPEPPPSPSRHRSPLTPAQESIKERDLQARRQLSRFDREPKVPSGEGWQP